MQHEHRLGEVSSVNLRRVVLGPVEVAALGPEPVTGAGRSATRAARTLIGRGAADLLDEQRAKATFAVEPGHPGEAAVDDVADAVDGHGSLGDVCRDDNLASVTFAESAVLICRRQFAVQRDQLHRLGEAPPAELADCASDFAHAGHENQDVSRRVISQNQLHRVGRLLSDRVAVAVLAKADLDRERAPVGGEHGAGRVRCLAKVAGHGAGLDGGRHDDDLQVIAARALEFFDEAKREVTHQVALVKLVEQHGTDAGQFGVILQTAQQHALGHELDFRLRAGVIFEPHLIAHTLAKRGVAFPGDAAGERAGGDAPGLHDDHAAFAAKDVVEDHLRHLRGLAGAGRRTENEAVLNRQRVGDFRVDVPDGERLAKRLGHGVGD